MAKIKVGILGATGMVGQSYIALLSAHPWFQVSYVVASEKSAGKTYGSAVEGRWHMQKEIPEEVRKLRVMTLDELDTAKKSCRFVFSALDSDLARIYEEKYAAAGIPVVSNASAHRSTEDVPVLIPEINPEHIKLINVQKKNRGWKGFIVVKPNCSLQSYIIPLYALKSFSPKRVIITTMQAVSGAGYPGVASYDITDNIIPYIKGEEEKSEDEPLKILGSFNGNKIIPAEIKLSAHCNRVPVIDGHLACVSVEFEKKPSRHDILKLWQDFAPLKQLSLPSAPGHPIIYQHELDRPQPRLDRMAENGMAITVGRLRECNVLHWRFVGLSHNTIRGAAGGGILNAELIKAGGLFDD